MATQGLFQQIGSQIAATAPFSEGMTLEVIHHPAGQGDVDALGTGGVRHRGSQHGRGLALDPLLQLLNQILKERHDFVKICSHIINDIVLDKIA